MLPFDKRQVKNVASCVVACVGSQQSVLWYWQVYVVLNAHAVPSLLTCMQLQRTPWYLKGTYINFGSFAYYKFLRLLS